jgi:hypothetical protein
MNPNEGFVYDYGRTRHPEGGECVRERRQTSERLEDFLCEAGLFVAEVLTMVAGFLYYFAIAFTIFMVAYFRYDGRRPIWWQRIAITHAIELCIGTAIAWGLMHLIAKALDARQSIRDRLPF